MYYTPATLIPELISLFHRAAQQRLNAKFGICGGSAPAYPKFRNFSLPRMRGSLPACCLIGLLSGQAGVGVGVIKGVTNTSSAPSYN
jgi:hypothetical protein